MAVMHPESLECYSCTKTEELFYNALREQLEERYHVFYSIRWIDKDTNGVRLDSECDFLVFDPSFGFITIEVKGGSNIDIEGDKWVLIEEYKGYEPSKRVLKCSPFKQAEKSMRHFHDYFEKEYNQQFKGTYGYAAAFPSFKINTNLEHNSIPDITIDLRDMNSLSEKINNIFHYWKKTLNIVIPFSSEQKSKFIDTIHKRISLSAAAGALIPIKKKEFDKIDFVQDSVIDMLSNYRKAQIIGGAGTGKTYIAAKKALRCWTYGYKTLYLSCNYELTRYVARNLIKNEEIQCKTYQEISHVSDTFDAIIIDEGQDFNTAMAEEVKLHLEDNEKSILYVLSDQEQNIFSTHYNDNFDIELPPFILRYNIRNTGEIYDYAKKTTNLGKETIANSLQGVKPEIIETYTQNQAVSELNFIINKLLNDEDVSNKSLVIIADSDYSHSILAKEKYIGKYKISFNDLCDTNFDEICFKTIDEFKGLEADVVIYLKNKYTDLPETETMKYRDYVALTRARYYLYVLSIVRSLKIGE
jgi:hypothetical protein